MMWTHPTASALTRYLLTRLHPEQDDNTSRETSPDLTSTAVPR
ncbi:hypothetical protein ABZ387_38315 [Streptomyces flaveolus]